MLITTKNSHDLTDKNFSTSNKMHQSKADPKSIRIHSDQADYYKYRTPYIPELFRAICKELHITKESTLMDLGCGRGEVANILSNYARKVHAIDGSKEMVDLAVKKDGIEYQVVDLNSVNPSISIKVDHLFFGRSIHWFPTESISRFSSDLLADGGKIVVCSTQWSPVGVWGKIYFETKQKFVFQTPNQVYDFTGKENLSGAKFVPYKKLAIHRIFKANIDFMIGHAFSTTYGDNLEKLRNLSTQFGYELKRALKIYEERGEIAMKVTTWAIIYGKSTGANI